MLVQWLSVRPDLTPEEVVINVVNFMRFALVPPVLFLELGGRFK